MSSRPEEHSDTTNAAQRSQSGENLVEQGEWVNCWLCEDVFRRRTQTKRTCAKCHRGFCEGWHGSLDRGYGTCVICWADQDVG
jgi:hypothetical protein